MQERFSPCRAGSFISIFICEQDPKREAGGDTGDPGAEGAVSAESMRQLEIHRAAVHRVMGDPDREKLLVPLEAECRLATTNADGLRSAAKRNDLALFF